MATQFDPIAKDQSINTTESPSRNIADVLAQELSGIATALTTASNTKLHLFNKLWENPSPSSAFSAQTITLASSDYDFLCILYRSDDIYNSTTIPKGHSATLNDSFAISSNLIARVRYLNRSSDTAYAVTDCTRVSYGSSTTQNDTAIPIAIYGFKKSVDINAIVSSISTDADKCMMSDGVTSVEQVITALQDVQTLTYAPLHQYSASHVFRFKKMGKTVIMTGCVIKNTCPINQEVELFTITNSDFIPESPYSMNFIDPVNKNIGNIQVKTDGKVVLYIYASSQDTFRASSTQLMYFTN